MKSNIFKYVFVLFVIGIILFAIYMIYFKKDNSELKTTQEVIENNTQIKNLRLGISNYDTINPLITNNKEILNLDKLIFEPLMTIDENYKLKNCLATECSKISETSYIIKIDNNKKWHDGTSLISKDIQFTINKLKESNSIYAYNVQKISNVEVIDATTVKINLEEEIPFFEYNLTFPILSNNYYIGEDFFADSKIPIGTGMYKIYKIEDSEIILIKNEKWWNKSNKNSKIEEIRIKTYSEVGEVYNSFKLGKTDIFTTSNKNLEEYIGTIGYLKTEIKGREFDYLAFNCENEKLKDKNIRKVIAYAINKNNIVSEVYNNEYCTSSFPLDYGSYLYKSKEGIYNQEQAENILKENGWEYKNKYWQKYEQYSTKKLSFTITVDKENENRVSVAQNIKEQLEQIGIKITINKVSNKKYNEILKNKNYEMIITGVYNSYSPNLEFFFGNDNLQNYYNEEIEKLLTEIKSVNDEKILSEKYQRIIDIFYEEYPFIGLYRNKITVIKSQNLSGEIKSNDYFSYFGIEEWYRK